MFKWVHIQRKLQVRQLKVGAKFKPNDYKLLKRYDIITLSLSENHFYEIDSIEGKPL